MPDTTTAKADLEELNIDGVILILPAGDGCGAEIIHLKSAASPNELKDLLNRLQAHHFRSEPGHWDADSYTKLYNSAGKLDPKSVRMLLKQRCDKVEFPQPLESSVPFQDADDFEPVVDATLTHFREEIVDRENGDHRPFERREDPEDKSGCLRVPDDMAKLAQTVNDFIKNSDPSGGGKVGTARAREWVNGSVGGTSLRKKLEDVVYFAKQDHVIYHEPHHEVTPGFMLIDEIFRALVAEVTVRVQALDAIDLSNPVSGLQELLAFVNGLEQRTGDSAKFGTYILPSGKKACDLDSRKSIHVDPSRIELFLEGDQIRVTSVIVGAWAGGTHSAGHTT